MQTEREQPTAAAVVIGDEILTGKVQDANTHVLAQMLFARGVRLCRVETVPDELDTIAEAVRRLSDTHDWVFTSGGIGPTHDDVTLEAVARAFGVGVAYHQETLDRMRAFYVARDGDDKKLNHARKKMVLFPVGAEVLTPDSFWVPVVVMKNVYVLPGVPGLFARLIEGIASRFAGAKKTRVRLYTKRPEGEIAELLGRAQREHPEVAIGSYPHYDAEDHKVMVTLEGLDPAAVESLAARLGQELEAFRRDGDDPDLAPAAGGRSG